MKYGIFSTEHVPAAIFEISDDLLMDMPLAYIDENKLVCCDRSKHKMRPENEGWWPAHQECLFDTYEAAVEAIVPHLL